MHQPVFFFLDFLRVHNGEVAVAPPREAHNCQLVFSFTLQTSALLSQENIPTLKEFGRLLHCSALLWQER